MNEKLISLWHCLITSEHILWTLLKQPHWFSRNFLPVGKFKNLLTDFKVLSSVCSLEGTAVSALACTYLAYQILLDNLFLGYLLSVDVNILNSFKVYILLTPSSNPKPFLSAYFRQENYFFSNSHSSFRLCYW